MTHTAMLGMGVLSGPWGWSVLAAALGVGLPALAMAAEVTKQEAPTTMTLESLPAETDGAVRGWKATAADAGVMDVRLVGGSTAKPGKFGNVLFDVRKTPLGARPFGNQSELTVELRVSPPFLGVGKRNWQRAHRARIVLEDRRGRRIYLPNHHIVDRPKSTDGWLTLRGRPTIDTPMPLGITDRGFDPKHIARIGVNVEAFNREGEVVEGTIEVRRLKVAFFPPVEPYVLGPLPSVRRTEKERAKRMDERLRARTGVPANGMAVGVNLAWPTAKSPEGEDLQLYGKILDGGAPWWGRFWDLSDRAVVDGVRADFQGIRKTFGEGAIVRLWLFGDGRSGIVVDAQGTPTGFTERAHTNLKALLDLARDEKVVLIPVLFDFGLADGVSHQGPDGAWAVGEHPDWITDSGKRAVLCKLVEALIKPLAGHEGVLAWEPMNEPENAVAVVNPENMGHLQRWLGEMTEAIHRAGELATVGSRNGIEPGPFLRGQVAADLGQAHYYPLLETRPNPSPFGIDFKKVYGPLPAGWGEAQTMPGTIAEQLRTAHAAGHRIFLYWSWRGHMEGGDGFGVQPYADEIRKALADGAAGPRK